MAFCILLCLPLESGPSLLLIPAQYYLFIQSVLVILVIEMSAFSPIKIVVKNVQYREK